MDKAKLTKLLAMTTSTHDGEALNAMRMANALIKSAGKTWGDVLTDQRVVTVEVFRDRTDTGTYTGTDEWEIAPHLKDTVNIEHMFRTIYAQPRSDNEEFWQFMDSIHHRFRKHGSLTQGQFQALRRCFSRVRA